MTSATKTYYQCKLGKDGVETTGWIEGRGATVGAKVEMKPSGELWEVLEAYREVGLPEDVLKQMQLDHRGSLPSVEPMGRRP